MRKRLLGDKNQKKRYLIFGTLLIVMGSFLAILNTQLPSVVESLHARGEIGLLKKTSLSSETEIRPPEYYTGMIEDRWSGPLTSVISGGLFLLFCLWFLQEASGLKFAAATFLYLLLSRFQVLFYPPCGDGLYGVLSEPLWLVRHHLDWIGLLQQKTYALGGPLQYPESIYPKLIALLMSIAPSPQAFLLMNHLIVFLAGAVLLATLREALLKLLDPKRAMLGAVLFLALPLFQCHVELLNMEVLCACFAAMGLLMAMRKEFFWGSAMAVFAVMIKAPGAITAAMLLGVCLLSFFKEPDKKKFAANLLWVLGACCITFYLLRTREIIVAQPGLRQLYSVSLWGIWKGVGLFWLFLCLTVLYLAHCMFWWFSEKNRGKGLPAFWDEHYKIMAILLIVSAWFLLLPHAPAIIPRYAVLVSPFVLLFFTYLFSRVVRKEAVFSWAMVAMILVSFLCSHGLLHLYEKADRSINGSERSLEYRNVLKLYRRAAAILEKKHFNMTIGSDILMAQILTFPEAGYVRNPFRDVFVYGSGATHEPIRPYPGLANIDVFRTVWVAKTDADTAYLSGFPVGPRDRILEEIWSGDKRITFFMGGSAVELWAAASAIALAKKQSTSS